MSPRKITIAVTITLLTMPAMAQSVPNPFLAPVQAPPPLQGTPPNSTPPMPDPITEPTPTIFTPYQLSPVVVEPQQQQLNVAPVNTFVFEPTPLLPPVVTQPEPTPEPVAPPTPPVEETAPPQEEPAVTEEAQQEPATDTHAEQAKEESAEPAPQDTPVAQTPPAPPVTAPQNPNDVLILGITTGVKPTAMIRVGGSLGIYNTGDELPNGLTIDSIEPLAVTFTLPEEQPEETEEDLEDTEVAASEDTDQEETPQPTTLRVNIQ